MVNFSFELHEFNESLTSYGTIETNSPSRSNLTITDFSTGTHLKTGFEEDSNSLILELENRLITLILDESGSMTWNDANADRHTYLRRLLTKLKDTYPGTMKANLISFGGVPVTSELLVTKASTDFISSGEGQNLNQLLQSNFQDSTHDFAGVRVVRRTDRFPSHPADGIVVGEGVFDAIKDDNLIEGQIYFYGIWSFNKDKNFSSGQFISGVPFDRILPKGVNFATASPRILPGVTRDSSTQIIYNFVEGSGSTVFDSSGNGKHGILGSQVIEDNFWIGDAGGSSTESVDNNSKKSIGVRFDGDFDILSADINDNIAMEASAKTLTISFWVYRYESFVDTWIIGTSQSITTNDIGWAIFINSSGQIGMKRDNISNSTLIWGNSGVTNFVPLEIWTMITISTQSDGITQQLYINGSVGDSFVTASINTTGKSKLYIGGFPTDSSATWSGSDYFGALNSISIHNVTRSAAYILNLYNTELEIFDQALQNSSESPVDNSQREVLLSWTVENDFDFSGGTIKIIRKYREVPTNENDGEEVISQNASSGQFFYLDTFDFINNADYYYQIYTFNSLGNPCDRADARVLSIHIPASFNQSIIPILSSIFNVSIIEGNHKVMLQWSNPTSDNNWAGTKIYYGTEKFPTISISSQGNLEVSDGFEIFDTSSREFFVHRKIGVDNDGIAIPLINGNFHYYTLVTYDRLNRLSEAVSIVGTTSSQLATVFSSSEIKDLHIVIVNPKTLSIQWNNPLVKSDKLELFFGESALIFVNIRDIFGGGLEDLVNMSLQVCTFITNRELSTTEKSLGVLGPGEAISDPCGNPNIILINGGCKHGARFDENCNDEREAAETIINFATVSSGLIKGILTHTPDASILTRRERYEMSIRSQYVVKNPETGQNLFEFNTEGTVVSFQHPLKISLVNKNNRKITPSCGNAGKIRGSTLCVNNCGNINEDSTCNVQTVNGAHINSTQPYLCRVELQYKGGALPAGTPVVVQLFKHSENEILSNKSDRVFIKEGSHNTTAVQEPLLNSIGNPTGDVVNKSIVDIEVPSPSLSDVVDIYVSIDYLGFFVDAIHTISFIGSLFVQIEESQPITNGIDVAEQFATVWTINPDDPKNPDSTVPVADGTLVKWELIKLRHGKNRPFYSTDPTNELISGVYSSTTQGVARNIFFGPISNVESHTETVCNELCCVGEEYAIKASVILKEETATDQVYATFPCVEDEEILLSRKFFMNAAADQPGQRPNYVTWADGNNLLKFQIAQNSALILDNEIPGASCFRDCIDDNFGSQLFSFPMDHIVQITAPGEILWNVNFGALKESEAGTNVGTDGGTFSSVENSENIISFESISPLKGQQFATAAVPITGPVTNFYVRLNKFVGDGTNPQPEDCGKSGIGGIGGGGEILLDCEWNNICQDSECNITRGIKWKEVNPVSGTSTFISNNIAITLTGGGGYSVGIPPIMAGFKEPLSVSVIETRINGQRTNTNELIVDGISQHTIVVEVLFANNPVPDGTPVELRIEGPDANIVRISNCINAPEECFPGSNGVIFTSLVNDQFINPTGEKKSLAYFSINPLPNIAFNAKIFVTCRYDKLKTAEREITRCVELNNTINVETINPETPPDIELLSTSVTSNESIIYDTISDVYSTTVGGNVNRISHFAASNDIATTTNIYIFGGYSDRDIDGSSKLTATAEKFDIASSVWTFITDMPTARAAGMTVIVNDIIYCIGGLELDPIVQQYVVSRKIESYDTTTETWNPTLASMPVDYGVTFGNAQYDGNDNIYILCGLNSVINNNQPNALNDRILRYTISTDVWTKIRPLDIPLYKRVSPFGFYRSNPLPFDSGLQMGYIYSGSIPKTLPEINAEFNTKLNQGLNDFRSFILTSPYYLNLTASEQSEFIQFEEKRISDNVIIPPYIYLSSGFKYDMGSEHIDSSNDLIMNIADKIDDEWKVLPKPRDRGKAVYIPTQDAVYFMGGSNQNQSTTLNRVETIGMSNEDNIFIKLTSFSRGRSLFEAVLVQEDIYFSGGLTSGHTDGYVNIELLQGPSFVEAQGNQSSGIVITLRDDAGEILDTDVRCLVRGRIRIPEIDNLLIGFLSARGADRALGGDGSGNAPDIPQAGDTIDFGQLIKAQNSIIDPNSDEFQFNASKKLGEQIFLFPVLYSEQEIIIRSGIGGVSLLPRSEDPLADFQKLAQFIDETLQSTPPDPNERFQGDLTRDELLALGDALQTVTLPPIILDSNTIRNLYDIETVITIIDDSHFGQTVSDFDLNIQEKINSRIEEILIPPLEPIINNNGEVVVENTFGGVPVSDSDCFLIQHLAAQEIPSADQPPPPNTQINGGPGGIGGQNQSGQCLFCSTLLPLSPSIQLQLPTAVATFYNSNDWVPQIKKRLTGGNTLTEVLEELDVIDHETPFGASQLYSAMKEASIVTAGELFESQKKSFYIVSDNSENFSLISRDAAIDEINAVDGDGNSPVIYTVFSTSFPQSLSTQLERNEVGDIEKIVQSTGGQASTLISSGFIDQILNLTINGATGGLGWGKYNKIIDLGELSAITDVDISFILPSNTQGFLRFRYSQDSFNFTDWTEKFEGTQTVDFVDFFAVLIEFEIILTTGFSSEVTEEYDSTPTGIPKLSQIIWGTSGEKEDFMFLNNETVLLNAQQIAVSFEGTVPPASQVEIGVASSNSHDWRDFQSSARPAMGEFGKTFLLERSEDTSSVVPSEPMITRDNLLYTTTYGSWDPTSTVFLLEVKNNVETPVLSGFRMHPREGEIYFDKRQNPNSIFKLTIVNDDKVRIGLRFRNRIHTNNIIINGVGYIYSTNDVKPIELSQVAPRALNVFISPKNPNSNDTINAFYNYSDLNGDPESGTLIKWFKNGEQLFEINNVSTWSNNNLQFNNKIQPQDKLHFTVTPSDGKDFGTTEFSPTIIINALPPSVQNLLIIATRNNLINNKFDTSSTFKVEYSFNTDDEGVNSLENRTLVRWFVNGLLFKQGTFSDGDTFVDDSGQFTAFDPRELSPVEVGQELDSAGSSAHIIGNEIIVEITPKTTLITGETTLSDPFSVVNSIPIITSVIIEPQNPTQNSTLQLSYNIDDLDIDSPGSTQSDQSEIKWFVSINGVDFVENTDVSGDVNVPPFFITAGQQWKVEVTGFDGLDISDSVESNIVTISV